MESHSSSTTTTTVFYGRLKRHSMRRQYQRLGLVCAKKDKMSRAEHSKIIRSASKQRSNVTAAQKQNNLLRRLRDSYVEMMLCLAGNIVQFNNGNVFLVQMIPGAPQLPT